MEGLFEEIIRAFDIPGTFIGHKELNTGNINQTYCLHFMNDVDEYYILQRINTYVFRQPEKMMGNILRGHLPYSEEITADRVRRSPPPGALFLDN